MKNKKITTIFPHCKKKFNFFFLLENIFYKLLPKTSPFRLICKVKKI